MGAQFEYRIINKSKATYDELQKEWNNIVANCLHESGHGSYSGTLKECSGMQIVNLHFSNQSLAYDWLEGNTQKWEAAKCVSYDDITEKVTQKITFNTRPATYWSSRSNDFRCVTRKFVDKFAGNSVDYHYADQLTDQQKKMLKREFEKYDEIAKDYETEKKLFTALHANSFRFFDPDVPFGPTEWKKMKQLRASLKKAKPKIDKAHAALAERDRKYADSIIKTKKINNGKKFLVGGWCSS